MTIDGVQVKQAVPFLGVVNIQAAVEFYVVGLGFTMTNQWVDDGQLRWCWLERGGGALMLQEVEPAKAQPGGMSLYFICQDALAFYQEVKARGINAKRPFVGNGMWVVSLTDPDGYQIHFESQTDAQEESEYTE